MSEQFKKNDKEAQIDLVERSKEEDFETEEEKLKHLEIIAKAVGEDCNIKIGISANGGWKYIFKPVDKIEVDANDLMEKGKDYCLGCICHEGAHKKISRVFFIPKKIWQERGFSYLMNAIEDPRVNNWASEKYDGAKKWIKRYNDEDLNQESTPQEVAKKRIGYIPKHIKFGAEIIRYWHTGKFSEDLPNDIKDILDKTINYAELAYNNIPEIINPSEENICDAAQKMYKIVYSVIWPEYQKLIEQSYEDEKNRQMIKDMIKNGEFELNDENQSSEGEPLPLDQLPDELKEEIKKKLKEKLDSMTEEDKKKFQEEMEDEANKVLDELEDETNKELKGKFSEQPKTKLEEQEEENKKAKREKTKKEIERISKEIDERLEKNKTEYTNAYQEVKPYIEKVANDIINLLITKRWPQFKKGFPGQRLRLEGAMKYVSKRDYKDLFEKRQKMERQEYRFTLLVDLSGSMAGSTIEETFKGVVLFVEALNKVASTLGGVKVSVYGFQDDLLSYKSFSEGLDDATREKMSIMKKEVENCGLHNKANYNNDGYCLDKIKDKVEESNEVENFLFVLSDGEPEGDHEHHIAGYDQDTEKEELREVIRRISLDNKIKLLGIGLGAGTDHVKHFYADGLNNVGNIPNVNVKRLSEILGDKIEELIK